MLGQVGERSLQRRRMGLQAVFFVAGETVAHVVGCVWKLIVSLPRALLKRGEAQKERKKLGMYYHKCDIFIGSSRKAHEGSRSGCNINWPFLLAKKKKPLQNFQYNGKT